MAVTEVDGPLSLGTPGGRRRRSLETHSCCPVQAASCSPGPSREEADFAHERRLRRRGPFHLSRFASNPTRGGLSNRCKFSRWPSDRGGATSCSFEPEMTNRKLDKTSEQDDKKSWQPDRSKPRRGRTGRADPVHENCAECGDNAPEHRDFNGLQPTSSTSQLATRSIQPPSRRTSSSSQRSARPLQGYLRPRRWRTERNEFRLGGMDGQSILGKSFGNGRTTVTLCTDRSRQFLRRFDGGL